MITIELLLMVDALKYRAMLIRDRHRSDRRFAYLEAGNPKAIQRARSLVHEDPSLAKVVFELVYQPLSVVVAGKADAILTRIMALMLRMRIRNFQTSPVEFEEFFAEFLNLEKALNLLNGDVHEQLTEEEELVPSLASTIRLYNRLSLSTPTVRKSARALRGEAVRDSKKRYQKADKPFVYLKRGDLIGRY